LAQTPETAMPQWFQTTRSRTTVKTWLEECH